MKIPEPIIIGGLPFNQVDRDKWLDAKHYSSTSVLDELIAAVHNFLQAWHMTTELRTARGNGKDHVQRTVMQLIEALERTREDGTTNHESLKEFQP